MKKRLFSFIVCVLLLYTAFAGCENQSNNNTSDTDSNIVTSGVVTSYADISNGGEGAGDTTGDTSDGTLSRDEIAYPVDPTPRVISYKQLSFGGFFTNDELEDNVIVRSEEELKAYTDLCQYTEENSLSEFLKNITSGYFNDKSIMFINCVIGASDTHETKKLYLNGTELTVTYSVKSPECVATAGYAAVLAYELDRADVIGIESITVKNEEQFWLSSHYTDGLKRIEFTRHFFDGELKNAKSETRGTASAGWLEIIHTQDELDAVLAKYTPHGGKNDFAEFASTLDENYFEIKTLIAIPLFFTYTNTKFSIEGVYRDDMQIAIATEFDESEISFDESANSTDSPYQYIAVIEINKADIPEKVYYAHQYKSIKND